MIKKIGLIGILSLGLTSLSSADFTGNFALSSDYIWRGMSQTGEDFAYSGGVDVSFTGPTFSGGVFGDGVGGAVRKEDTDILDMWNEAIAEMSEDGTTAEITKKWFGRDISM